MNGINQLYKITELLSFALSLVNIQKCNYCQKMFPWKQKFCFIHFSIIKQLNYSGCLVFIWILLLWVSVAEEINVNRLKDIHAFIYNLFSIFYDYHLQMIMMMKTMMMINMTVSLTNGEYKSIYLVLVKYLKRTVSLLMMYKKYLLTADLTFVCLMKLM